MSGETTGTVRLILRLEGLCVLIAALLAYSKLESSWGTFAWFFFVPDLALFGYLAGSHASMIAYNATHTYIGAVFCLMIGFGLFFLPALVTAGLIWCAHIGFDRALGYGLKYPTGFIYTHLGVIGQFSPVVPTLSRRDL